MRILQVGKYYHPYKGGMETALRQVCEGLVAQGHEVRALVAGGGATTRREGLGGQAGALVRVATWGTWNSQPLTLTLPRVLAREIADFAPDVVQLHLPNPGACWAWQRLGRRRGKLALAVWYHADITRQRLGGRLFSPLLRRCLGEADGICVSTEALARTSPVLQPWRDKVRVIPFGIDPEPFADVGPAAAGPFLFVGRLVRYKGLLILVEAVGNLPGAELEIAGSGPLAGEVADLIARGGWGDRIRLLGEIPDEALPGLLARSRALVLPSLDRSETFGLCLLEAMAAGRPVVTSDLDSGVLEVNVPGVTGWTAPPGDVAAWTRVLAEVLADPDEARVRGEAGRRRVRERFHRERMAQDLAQWYAQLARAGASDQRKERP
jgi:glycosyltransferase involved in cell wall biosynthesis